MTNRYIKNLIILAGILGFSLTSCTDDLDLSPEYEVTSANVYNDVNSYKQVLAKLYGGLVLTGQQGPTGRADIAADDEGMYSYTRAYWMLQEVPTDEAAIAWQNEGNQDLNTLNWGAGNPAFQAMFDRIYYQIVLANEFIRETSDARLAERGVSGSNLEEVQRFRAEARFVRALCYWHAIDLFGNVPFVTEDDPIGNWFPEQRSRAEVFEYIESELLSLVDGEGNDELIDARANEQYRADKAAAWTLLAKLYLNAEVYINEARYTEAVTYSEMVIDAGYVLEPDYEKLFMADNHTAEGIIFAIASDGRNSQSYGSTTFFILASIGGDMAPSAQGVSGGWGGIRTYDDFVSLFPEEESERAMFVPLAQTNVEDLVTFNQGYGVVKYKNLTSDGIPGSDPTSTFADTDFPMFRLADVYLMYAEAVLRGGSGGDVATALGYINALRQRAFGNDSGNISANELNLDFILDERARELYWEAHRRTDLIRFGRFTSNSYVWPWKGGVQEGTGVEDYKTIFPIPQTSLVTNPSLIQNTGYSR